MSKQLFQTKPALHAAVAAIILGTLIPLSLKASSGAAVTTLDVHEVADICMYSQRLLKDYALVGMGVDYHNPGEDLKKGAKVVNQYLAELKSHHLDGGLDKEIHELDGFWKKIEPQLVTTPSKKGLAELYPAVDRFSERCEEVAYDLSNATGIAAEHHVVVIAQLGMEVQKLAALYMMKAWGLENVNYYKQVQALMDEVEALQNELKTADDTLVPSAVKEKLKTFEEHFLVFEIMAASKSGRFVPTRAEKKASEIFAEVREILALEEELVE